jgi:hypothetical protein
VCLHGVPKNIVSDRGTQFTSRFWEKKLHEAMNTWLNFTLAYNPQTDGQTEGKSNSQRHVESLCFEGQKELG